MRLSGGWMPTLAYGGLLWSGLAGSVMARSWREIEPLHGLDPTDHFLDTDVLLRASNPLNEPTPSPTTPPTTSPPTQAPTAAPTTASPTEAPTASPTEPPDPYPFNEPPSNPDPWYFNYDTRDTAKYGPGKVGFAARRDGGFDVTFMNNAWRNVNNPPNFYWNEFDRQGTGAWADTLSGHNPSRNRCNRVGYQSPIDVRVNGKGRCEEHHEVRSLMGDFRLSGDKIDKRIENNKLRLVYQRRPCGDLRKVECQEPDPPHADFPHGWGGFADVMHVDFKVPSEHTIKGVRYDAEMQIYHLHPGRRRMPTQATVIRATPDGYNWYFEGALKAFEYVYHRDLALCSASKRRDRQLVSQAHQNLAPPGINSTIDYDTWAEFSTDMDAPDYEEYAQSMERMLQGGRWDPHHEMLVPSIYFYRYEGSLTEPPCGEWVSWFVTDEPMIISLDQLERMKHVLFNHVDYACRRTSVQYGHSVARPLQDTAGRSVYLCTSKDYGPDP